jgi:hypothetical protein
MADAANRALSEGIRQGLLSSPELAEARCVSF